MKLITKTIIRGCEARGDAGSPYLTRYTLPRIGPVRANLHVFHRSDADEHHDHPWNFVSVILWRGYIEETKGLVKRDFHSLCDYPKILIHGLYEVGSVRKRVWPGMILYRKAEHRHRVELVNGKKAVTLVFMFKRRREWGFFTKRGWQNWREYFAERGC